jgi:hypothetical protein
MLCALREPLQIKDKKNSPLFSDFTALIKFKADFSGTIYRT